MPIAFVLINTELGSEKQVLDELIKIDEVKESCIVYGIHDITAKISAKSMDKLDKIITYVRDLDKIRGTVTLILIEAKK